MSVERLPSLSLWRLHSRRLTSVMCDVKLDIVKDPGSQLRGAHNGLYGWSMDWDKQMLVNTRLEKDLEWLFILSYSQYQEVATRVMVKIVKNQKKTLPKSIVKQVLSMNEMANLMTVTQKPIEKEANSKSDGIPMCTPMTTTSSKPDGTPISTPSSKSDYPLMDTSNFATMIQSNSGTNSNVESSWFEQSASNSLLSCCTRGTP